MRKLSNGAGCSEPDGRNTQDIAANVVTIAISIRPLMKPGKLFSVLQFAEIAVECAQRQVHGFPGYLEEKAAGET